MIGIKGRFRPFFIDKRCCLMYIIVVVNKGVEILRPQEY